MDLAARIQQLEDMVKEAKSMPLSSSALLNREELLEFVEQSTTLTYTSSARLEGVLGGSGPAGYPEFYGLARRLRLIAQLIKAGLATSIGT